MWCVIPRICGCALTLLDGIDAGSRARLIHAANLPEQTAFGFAQPSCAFTAHDCTIVGTSGRFARTEVAPVQLRHFHLSREVRR